MNQPNPHINGLILRFLKKETSQEELLELQAWLSQNKDNVAHFDRVNTEYQKQLVAERLSTEYVAASWDIVNSRITDTKSAPVIRLLRSNVFRVAASLALFALVIWRVVPSRKSETNARIDDKVVLNSTNTKSPIILPDSTLVWLNANSSIEYTSTFSENREVILKGEGFFDVRKKGMQTFVVKTTHFSIQVKGTRFNVQAYESEFENATLEEGSIELKLNGDGPAYELAPGDQLTINNTAQTVELKKVNPLNFTAWKEDKLIFDNTRLSEIIVKIENRYNVNIVIDESLAHRERMTMAIEHEPIEEILEMIHLSSQLNYKIENETIVIYE